jgi:hypothetical protein
VNSARPVRLALSPAPGFALLIVVAHGIAGGCFLTIMTGWPAVSAAVLVLSLGAAAAWHRALLRSSRSPRAIEISPSGEASCLFADGSSCAIAARPGGVSRFWVSLRLRDTWSRSLLVVAGMLPTDAFRLLRLWALWGRLPDVARRQLAVLP